MHGHERVSVSSSSSSSSCREPPLYGTLPRLASHPDGRIFFSSSFFYGEGPPDLWQKAAAPAAGPITKFGTEDVVLYRRVLSGHWGGGA